MNVHSGSLKKHLVSSDHQEATLQTLRMCKAESLEDLKKPTIQGGRHICKHTYHPLKLTTEEQI